jgi:hypothetical protein
MGPKRVLVLIALLLGSVAAAAQNAKVYGTVYNLRGAPYAHVAVELQNAATGVRRSLVTDADGDYSFTEVPPAEGYTISAMSAGKIIAQQSRLTVHVGDEKLLIPPLQEQANAKAGTAVASDKRVRRPELATVSNEVSTSIGAVISNVQLQSLPLYNRNFLALGLLTPSTHDVEAGSSLSGATFSVAGARPSANDFLLDGVDNSASSSGQASPFQVNDSIQEFRVTAAVPNAEYGRNLGGVINVVTRRAQSGFHGGLFGYYGSGNFNSPSPLSVYGASGFEHAAGYAGSLNSQPVTRTIIPGLANQPPITVGDYNTYVATARANGFCTDSIRPSANFVPSQCIAQGLGRNTLFDPAALLQQDDSNVIPLVSRQFGANIGKSLNRDRFFMFLSYEGTRIDNPTPVFERVPSAIDKTGVQGVSGLDTASASYAQKILGLYPKANVIGVPGVLEFYRGNSPNYTNVDNVLFRTDFKSGYASDWLIRYSGQRLGQLHDDTLPASSAYPGNGAIRNALNQSLAIGLTHRLDNSATTDLRFGATRFQIFETPQDAAFNAAADGLAGNEMMTYLLSGLDSRYSGARQGVSSAYTGWYNAFWNTSNSPNAMAPSLDGLFPFARIGAPLSAPSKRRDTTLFALASLSLTKGRHQFKLGGEFRHLENVTSNAGFSRGLVVSSDIGEFTSDSETCNDPGCAAFTKPSFDYAVRQQEPYGGRLLSRSYGAYIQDSWRVNSHLLLSGGVRWDYRSVPVEAKGQLWNFDPKADGLVEQGGSAVVDPYGYACANGFARTDSIYAAHSGVASWSCAAKSSQSAVLPPRRLNFAPRFGFAYSFDRQGKTVLRGGIGEFFGEVPVSAMAQLEFNRPTPINFANPEAIYGQNFATTFCNSTQCGLGNSSLAGVPVANQSFQSASIPSTLYGRDYTNSKTPVNRQVALTLQRQLSSRLAMEIGFIGANSQHLPVVYNSGFENEWFCTSNPGCDNFSFSPLFTMANLGTSEYRSGMLKLRGAQWKGLSFEANYIYSTSYDNGSQGAFPLSITSLPIQVFGLQAFGLANPDFLTFGGRLAGAFPGLGKYPGVVTATNLSDLLVSGLRTTGAGQIVVTPYNIPQDPINFLKDEYGPSDFDSRHRFVADYTWELPFAKRSFWLSHIVVSGITIFQTGQPFTIFSGPAYGELTQRADVSGVRLTGDPNAYITGQFSLPGSDCRNDPVSASPYVTGAALYGGAPGLPCAGTSPRNGFTGPSYITHNLSLQKGFPMGGETRMLIVRVEVYNVLDRANYYNPISALSLDGLTVNPDFGKILSAHEPRQLQFSTRFYW